MVFREVFSLLSIQIYSYLLTPLITQMVTSYHTGSPVYNVFSIEISSVYFTCRYNEHQTTWDNGTPVFHPDRYNSGINISYKHDISLSK